MLKKLSVEEFINKLSSEEPAPGGGGVAALSAALASSLNSMVYSLTVNKEAFNNLSDDDKKVVLTSYEKSKELSGLFLEYIERDKEAYLGVINAYKMKKDTGDEVRIRKQTIDRALEQAMLIPFELAKTACEFYEEIETALKFGNKNLIADVAVAAVMMNAAVESSIVNVKVNLRSLNKNGEFKFIEEKTHKYYEKSLIMKNEILNSIDFLK